jgi:microcystin-dependent protein
MALLEKERKSMSTEYGIIALHAAAPMNQEARIRLGLRGWNLCDGSALGADLYPYLFTAINVYFGGEIQNGVIYRFNLPNLSEYFPRGVNGNAINPKTGKPVDPDTDTRVAHSIGNAGNKVGSYQLMATGTPTNPFITNRKGAHAHTADHLTSSEHRSYHGTNADIAKVGNGESDLAGNHFHTLGGGDPATVPVNMAIWYIIKCDVLD